MDQETLDRQVAEAHAYRESFIGKPCVYFDEFGNPHHALVTAVWDTDDEGPKSVNLVYVVSDAAKVDQYGRQIERKTSVVHRTRQGAHGMFFEMPNELTAG